MKKAFRIGATGVAIAAAMGMSSVAHADNADATATAEILEALTLDLQTGTSLDFGSMVVSAASTVSLDAATGALDCTDAGVTCTGTSGVPTFDVGGTANKEVTINLPASITMNHTNGTDSLSVGSIASDGAVDPLTGDESVTLDAAGDASFSVGGEISVDENTEPGVYTGTFNVSVEYS